MELAPNRFKINKNFSDFGCEKWSDELAQYINKYHSNSKKHDIEK
jgi:hypothetical protein